MSGSRNREIVLPIARQNFLSTLNLLNAVADTAQEIVTKDKVAVVGVYTQETTLAVEPNLHGVWLEASQGEPVFDDAYFGSES